MLKETITYTDYNGVERTEDFYFNFTEAELMEMEMSTAGGLEKYILKIVNTQDTPSITKIFKELILKAYGEKSPDGRRFIKTEELTLSFTHTEAYSKLYMQLATDDVKAAAFVNGVMPSSVIEKMNEKTNKKTNEETNEKVENIKPVLQDM